MFNIVICDDEESFIQYMKKQLQKSGLRESEVAYFEYQSGEELIKSLAHWERIDLLILDMQMKQLSGNETAKLFRQQFPSSVIVFCSGVYLPTVECFETTPFRYLLKEYTDHKMLQELKVIVQELRNKVIEPVVIGTWRYSTVKLELDEILYISIARNGCNIYVKPNGVAYEFEKNITSKKKLLELYFELKDYGFEYAHNSYIVNLNHIKRKTTKELELSDGTRLSIARSKEKGLRLAFARNTAGKY